MALTASQIFCALIRARDLYDSVVGAEPPGFLLHPNDAKTLFTDPLTVPCDTLFNPSIAFLFQKQWRNYANDIVFLGWLPGGVAIGQAGLVPEGHYRMALEMAANIRMEVEE